MPEGEKKSSKRLLGHMGQNFYDALLLIRAHNQDPSAKDISCCLKGDVITCNCTSKLSNLSFPKL